jgi:hypothetical protein
MRMHASVLGACLVLGCLFLNGEALLCHGGLHLLQSRQQQTVAAAAAAAERTES